jgi:hypothetical protein
MKHVNSGQCMTVDEKRSSGKLIISKLYLKRNILKRMNYILGPCKEGIYGQQRWDFGQPMLV